MDAAEAKIQDSLTKFSSSLSAGVFWYLLQLILN